MLACPFCCNIFTRDRISIHPKFLILLGVMKRLPEEDEYKITSVYCYMQFATQYSTVVVQIVSLTKFIPNVTALGIHDRSLLLNTYRIHKALSPVRTGLVRKMPKSSQMSSTWALEFFISTTECCSTVVSRLIFSCC